MIPAAIYRYGARAPIGGAERVEDQLLRAHRYRNALVEVERARRAAVSATLETYPESDRKVPPAIAAVGEINARVAEYRRSLRAACGVFWGTYLLVEAAIDAARCKSTPPHFRSWDRTGRIGIQVQSTKPLTVGGALAGGDTRLRIERLPDPPGMTGGSRRSGRRAVVHVRVGSVGRDPVWASWRVTLHRLPPADARIAWAWMQRVRIGPDYRWFLHLTVQGEREPDQKVRADRAGTVAIDLGWRVRPDGVRVGYWRDGSGAHGELLFPADLREKMEHARSIDAIRDRAFNDFRPLLTAWLASGCCHHPDWLARDAAMIAQWRSAERLYRLTRRWERSRFDGDALIFTELRAWAKQDRHLSSWAAHETAKVIARRDETYRSWSVDFARRYSTVVIERFDLRLVAGRRDLAEGATGAEKVRADRASSVRHIVAPGTFRRILVESCAVRACAVSVRRAEWTTIDCAACGVRMPWDPAPHIEHRCAACGVVADQDDQACRNLLIRAAESSGPVAAKSSDPLADGISARQLRFREARRLRGLAKLADGGAPRNDATEGA